MPRKPAKRVIHTPAQLPDDLDKDTLFRLVGEIPRLARLATNRRLKPLGLSEAKWRSVLHLSRGPADMSQVELAGRLSIEASTLARLVDRLAADGWIERRAALNDRRTKTIHLLPKASSVIRQINHTVNEMRNEILTGPARTELNGCLKALQQLLDPDPKFPLRIGTSGSVDVKVAG